ncbi:MAG: hypothetical protein IJU10_04555 [Clostridia bacterium]|nr:hypothetical protein [Clostridia bacterium]
MKKTVSFLFVIALILAVVLGLVACNDATVTDSDLQKVQKAFSGVESSMKSSSSMSVIQAEKPLYLAGADGIVISENALQTIWSTYVSGDQQASAEELEYDQPPMRQFQYLKAIFEQMGDDYELGTKYYYDITGQMYFDMETGYPVDPSEVEDAAAYLYNYVFGFALSIELKANDLIFAEVAFKIGLTHGSSSYNTSWYVSFDLDYDFDESKPTYTLAMYTDNKEGELAFLDRAQGYEYDYVQVSKGSVKEWRKFVMDASEEIVIDAAHPSFESYLSEGIAYNADTAKWLKDGKFYKVTQLTAEKNRTLATAFVDGIGMNSTAIGAATFLAKNGKVNPVIDTYYKSICQLYGGDIIYDLVCKKDYSNSGNNGSSAHAWNSSVGSVVGALSSFVPGFESATASFSAIRSEDGSVMISVSGAAADDYARFVTALERVGFAVSERQKDGTEVYVKVTSDKAIIVAINTERNYIVVAVTANGNGGNGGDGTNEKTITLHEYLPAYAYGYTAYNAGVRYTAVKDLTPIIETISFDLITPDEITAEGSLSVMDSWFYDITLGYDASSGKTKAEVAADIAKAYSGAFLSADIKWTSREYNMLHYATINGKEVLVLLATDVANGDPHLYVYMLQFEEGNIPQILDGNGNGNGSGTVSGDGGDVTGGDENGNGGEGGEVSTEPVNVIILHYDERGFESTPPETRTYTLGEELTLQMITGGEKQKVFLDATFNEEITTSVKATKGLVLYVRAVASEGNEGGNGTVGGDGTEGGNEGGNESRVASVTFYYLNEKGSIDSETTQSYELGTAINLTDYEGKYVIYTDKDRKNMVTGSIKATEGLTLYIMPKTVEGGEGGNGSVGGDGTVGEDGTVGGNGNVGEDETTTGNGGNETTTPTYVSVVVVTLNAEGHPVKTESVTAELGKEMDLTKYMRSGKLYADRSCTQEITGGSVLVEEGLTIYIMAK